MSTLIKPLILTLALALTLNSQAAQAGKKGKSKKRQQHCQVQPDLFVNEWAPLGDLAARRAEFERSKAELDSAFDQMVNPLWEKLGVIDDKHPDWERFANLIEQSERDYDEMLAELEDKYADVTGGAKNHKGDGTPRGGIDKTQQLSKKEKKRLAEEEKRKEAEAARLRERQRLLVEVANMKKTILEQNPRSQAIRDGVVARWLKALDMDRTVALLLGNPYTPPSPAEAEQLAQLVREVAAKAYVLYDADSAAAPLVSEAAGERGIGLSGRPERASQGDLRHVVTIVNPYLRMKAFVAAQKRGMTPDSVTGMGLVVNDDMRVIIDPTSKWTQGMMRFSDSIRSPEVNLGVNYAKVFSPDSISSVGKAADRLTPFGKKEMEPIAPFDFESAIDELRPSEFYEVDRDARYMSEGIAKMQGLPKGSVVFGGGKYEERYAQLVYSTVYQLGQMGHSIATGGSGGFMEIANTAAFNAGADSIGIPLGGITLSSERRNAETVQTLSVSSFGYETRIPLLLEDRGLVLLAPGGSGTMKELATTLVHMGAHPSSPQQLVFISKGYYGSLYDWWAKDLAAPEFMQRVHIIEDPSEIRPIAEKVPGLGTPDSPKPRSDAKEYAPPPESKSPKGGGSMYHGPYYMYGGGSKKLSPL